MKSKKSKFERFMAILICLVVLSLFVAGYAMALFDSVIAPVFVDDSDTISVPEKNESKVSSSKSNKTEPLPVDVEKTETNVPTISVGSINSEHKNDPDYDTYEINVTGATYTVEENGKLVKKAFPNMKGGTISVPKKKSNTSETEQVSKDIDEQNGEKKDSSGKGSVIPENRNMFEENLKLLREAYPNEYAVIATKINDESIHINILKFIDIWIIDDINLLIDAYKSDGYSGMENHIISERNINDRVLK